MGTMKNATGIGKPGDGIDKKTSPWGYYSYTIR